MATGLTLAALAKGSADTVLTWDVVDAAPKWTSAATTDANSSTKGLTRDALDAIRAQLTPAMLASAPNPVSDKGKLLSTKSGGLLLETPAFLGGGVGATGAAGASGVGATGATGAGGAVGATGPVGETGPTGAVGATGQTFPSIGATGPVGATGAKGLTGVTGPTGPASWRGRYSVGAIYPTPISDTTSPAPVTATSIFLPSGEFRVLADDVKDFASVSAGGTATLNVGSLVTVSARGSYFIATKAGTPIDKWTLYGSPDGTTWTVLDDRTDRNYGLSTEGYWHEIPYTAVHSEVLQFRHFKLEVASAAYVRFAVRHKHA